MNINRYVKGTLISLEESKKEKNRYKINLAGRDFIIFPNVFSPRYFKSSGISLNEIKIKEGYEILEIGCGVGIFSILAALNGASKVVAIDINPDAVRNTEENVILHSLKDKVTVLQGDVYSPLSKEDRFDLIFWNVPFLYTDKEVQILERSVFDPGYRSIEKFILEARNHLKSTGRAIVEFSPTMGKPEKIREMIKNANMDFKVIHKEITDYKGIIGKVELELIEIKPKDQQI